tara:strand:- start:119 stop:406 length:288 start_codon:yes stop_codon:yes gene_type:complete
MKVDGTKQLDGVKPGETIVLQLKAALNIDPDKRDKAWVLIRVENESQKVEVLETEVNSGIFSASYKIPNNISVSFLELSYGYLGFEKSVELKILN